MNPDVVVRPAQPADAAAIAKVRVESWRASYRGIVPDAYLDAMSVEDNTTLWQRILASGSPEASIYVAAAGDEVIGFASVNRRDVPKLGFDAELSAIYLRPDRKRQGIGRRLVATVAAAQRQRGASGLIVWVFAKNQDARAFYEALGGELLVEQTFQWDGVDLVEVSYGFRDLDALASLAGPNPALH